jgi:TolB-like protein
MRPLIQVVRFATAVATAFAAVAITSPAAAQAPGRPVVVVLPFDNNSIGAGAREFDGLGKGVQDFLITDLAGNSAVRLVDRSHIETVLKEQDLAAGGRIDAETAVRIGKILGAQYAVVGGFLADGKGNAVLTGRTIDIETTQIGNPQKIEGRADDVLGMISQLSSKLASGMSLAPKPGRRVGDAGDAAKSPAPAQSGAPAAAKAAAPAKSDVELFAKPVSEKTRSVKLDGATLKLYSTALDEMDKKNNAKAKDLLKQVLVKYEGWEPATRLLAKLG